MKLAIISVIVMSLAMSQAVEARESDRHGARKSAKPNASKAYKPRQQRRAEVPRAPRKQAQQRPSRSYATPPKRDNRSYQSKPPRQTYDRGNGFGSPKNTISNNRSRPDNKVYRGNNSRSDSRISSQNNRAIKDRQRQVFTPDSRRNDRANNRSATKDIRSGVRDNRATIRDNRSANRDNRANIRDNRADIRDNRSATRDNRISRPDTRSEYRGNSERRLTTKEVRPYRGNQNSIRPSDRTRSGQRAGSGVRLPESMPLRRYSESNRSNIKQRNNGRRVDFYRPNQRDNFRYQQHRWLVNKQKHRRHTISMPRQLQRYRNNHFRGRHHYGTWHRGHNHYHYDYRYRYLFNPYQWYDDYYYHAYFNWRWNHPSYWRLSGYYDFYMDPYYCPDDFGHFITTLAVGALILSW